MQFRVPKSIDIEDKVIGPLTVKQAVFVGGAIGTVYVFFQLFPTIFAVLVSIPIAVIALSLAFVKINGQPFIKIMQSFILYMKKDRFYLWHHETTVQPTDEQQSQKSKTKQDPQLSPEDKVKRLQDVAWALDVLDRPQPAKNTNNS
jgi:hypothetical protein